MTDVAPVPRFHHLDPSGQIGIIHRLHFKIATFVIATILVIFGSFLAYQLYSYQHKLTRLEMESSEALCQTLTSSLEIAMLNRDIPAIQHSFEGVAGSAHILKVFLLDTLGEVKAASDRGMVAARFRKADAGCRDCHGAGGSELLGAIIPAGDDQVLRVVVPVVNKPQCHTCHGDQPRYNGLLVMDRSLQPVKAEILGDLRLAGIVAGVSVLLMMLLFRWYIKRQVINRVVYLESLARRVAANELSVDIALGGKDELASLARSVDNMKSTLQMSIDRIANHRVYLTNLLENLIDGILILDDGRQVVFVNKAVSDILGLDAAVLRRGGRLNFTAPPLDRLALIGDMIAAADTAGEPLKSVVKLKNAGPEDRHLEIHVGTLMLPPRLKPEIIVVIRDITTRVVAENQVYQSERLATVGRLAAGIAHEINNPMASILTCAEGLLKGPGLEDEGRQEYLQVIKSSAQRCKMITQKLLDYGAASTLTKEIVDLRDVLQESVSLLQFEAGRKGVRLEISEPEAIPVIAGSRDSLVQVVVNLILNGIQAVDHGGRIQVAVETHPATVDILVIDDGPGISAANLPRIFEPFFTTKPVGMGTGLGLSVSEGIVKRHGGTIEVTESRGGFTAVRVSLPVPPVAGAR